MIQLYKKTRLCGGFFMLLALGIASFLTSAAIAKNPRDLQSPALGLWQVLDWPKGD